MNNGQLIKNEKFLNIGLRIIGISPKQNFDKII